MDYLIQDLSFSKGKTDILKGVSATFKHGRFHVLVGPNGAGKTTLMRLMLGMYKANGGQISLGGEAIQGMRPDRLAQKVAYVPQRAQTELNLKAEAMVGMARYLRQKGFASESKHDKEIVRAAMEAAGCLKDKDKGFQDLSGGERQRVLLARALAQESAWILLDEPVSNLDLRYSYESLLALKKLQVRKGLSMLCVLHDLSLAYLVADEVLLLNEGEVLLQGKRDEVFKEDLLSKVYGLPIRRLEDEGQCYFLPKLNQG